MGRIIREFEFFSFRRKALSVLFLLVISLTIVNILANAAQPVNSGSVDPNTVIISSEKVDTSNRGRVPEPSTMVLMGSGFVAGLVRFARRRFAEFKRGFDILMALIGLTLSAPVLLVCSLIIKFGSQGPILYRQTRVGINGRLFDVLKLRTMVADAEIQTGPVWAKENDPRVTPFGNFLRKSRIDEIPQLVNVLKGEMSVIGPRPERPEFVDMLTREIPDYQKRLAVRPGITGLAQIRQSYDSTIRDVRKKVKLDLLYIKRMCFLTDLRILLNTVVVVLTARGAR